MPTASVVTAMVEAAAAAAEATSPLDTSSSALIAMTLSSNSKQKMQIYSQDNNTTGRCVTGRRPQTTEDLRQQHMADFHAHQQNATPAVTHPPCHSHVYTPTMPLPRVHTYHATLTTMRPSCHTHGYTPTMPHPQLHSHHATPTYTLPAYQTHGYMPTMPHTHCAPLIVTRPHLVISTNLLLFCSLICSSLFLSSWT